MTDHHDPLDDLASAHVDGEQDLPDPLDDDLRARVELLATARDALRGADAPIDPIRREQAIAAALAAFDDEPVELGHGMARRRSRRRPIRLVEMAGIAAAIVLVALVVPLLGRLDSGSDQDVVAPPAESTEDAASGGSARTQMALGSADASASDLGSFSDVSALTDAVRAQLAEPTGGGSSPADAETTSGPTPTSTEPACADERTSGGPEVFAASATLSGRRVLVVVQEDQAGRTLVVLDSVDCSTVSRTRL